MNYLELYKAFNIPIKELPIDIDEQNYAKAINFKKVQLLKSNKLYYTYSSCKEEADCDKHNRFNLYEY